MKAIVSVTEGSHGTRGPGAPKGSRNAAKGRDAKLHSPVNPSLKALCVKLLIGGESLSDFVETALAKEALLRDPVKAEAFGVAKLLQGERPKKDKRPLWTRGLSERTADCLLSAGFTGKVQVRRASVEGFDFYGIPNFGRSCDAELNKWLSK